MCINKLYIISSWTINYNKNWHLSHIGKSYYFIRLFFSKADVYESFFLNLDFVNS